MNEQSSSVRGRSLRNALLARRASHAAFSSGLSVAGSTLRRFLESRASRLIALTASCASWTAARTRDVSSELSVLSVSWRPARISGAVRVSATASTAGATETATTGTVTSDFAADLRATLAGAASVAGATSGFLAVFLSAGMFELTTDFTAGISNAGGILLCILTCLNHNLSDQNNFAF